VLGPARSEEAFSRGLQLGLDRVLEVARGEAAEPAPLTARKREIAALVAAGLANKEIARQLSISERTVDADLEQLRNQLGLHNRAQVAVWATLHARKDGG
jgi:non-specific serine/threonine protein kinase